MPCLTTAESRKRTKRLGGVAVNRAGRVGAPGSYNLISAARINVKARTVYLNAVVFKRQGDSVQVVVGTRVSRVAAIGVKVRIVEDVIFSSAGHC